MAQRKGRALAWLVVLASVELLAQHVHGDPQGACVACANNCTALGAAARAPGYKFRVAMATIVNNEGRWMAEWILYHRVVGFDHFYIYDDDSTDDTLTALAPFRAKGLVTVYQNVRGLQEQHGISVPAHIRFIPQFVIVQHAARVHAADVEWLAYLDVDEFVVPRASYCISALLDAAKPTQGVLRLLGHLFLPNASDHEPLARERLLLDTAHSFVPDRLLTGKDRVPLHKNIARPRAIAHTDHGGIHHMRARAPLKEHAVKKTDFTFAHFRFRTMADFDIKKRKAFRGHHDKAEVLARLEAQLGSYLRDSATIGPAHPFHRYVPAVRAQYAALLGAPGA